MICVRNKKLHCIQKQSQKVNKDKIQGKEGMETAIRKDTLRPPFHFADRVIKYLVFPDLLEKEMKKLDVSEQCLLIREFMERYEPDPAIRGELQFEKTPHMLPAKRLVAKIQSQMDTVCFIFFYKKKKMDSTLLLKFQLQKKQTKKKECQGEELGSPQCEKKETEGARGPDNLADIDEYKYPPPSPSPSPSPAPSDIQASYLEQTPEP
ncbi:hypothetical protein RFI_39989, partial [Reticulomyxa filosa]